MYHSTTISNRHLFDKGGILFWSQGETMTVGEGDYAGGRRILFWRTEETLTDGNGDSDSRQVRLCRSEEDTLTVGNPYSYEGDSIVLWAVGNTIMGERGYPFSGRGIL